MAIPFLWRSRNARWAVPVGVVAAVGAGLGIAPVVAGAQPGLPSRTPAALLAGVAQADQHPFSGTVVATARLGLPELPGAAGSTSLQSLVTGSHTARIWYAAPDQARFALVGTLAETDVVRRGSDVWVWTSSTRTAQHLTLPRSPGTTTTPATPQAVLTPQQAAAQALAAVGPTTVVSVDGSARVAGRSAYELVLRPRQPTSLVDQVRVAVDAATSVPLRVQVYAKGSGKPAFETGFAAVRFGRPAASMFRFVPPPGAIVKQQAVPHGSASPRTRLTSSAPTVLGTGWSSVLVVRGVDLAAAGSNPQLAALLRSARPVSGRYGSGLLLPTRLVSVLALADGRLAVGAVTPAELERVVAGAPGTAR
jgi:outer membrane lipoprotein-sorting protein